MFLRQRRIRDEARLIAQLEGPFRDGEVEDVVSVAANYLANSHLRAIVHRGLAIHHDRCGTQCHDLARAFSIPGEISGLIRRGEIACRWPGKQEVSANILVDGIRYRSLHRRAQHADGGHQSNAEHQGKGSGGGATRVARGVRGGQLAHRAEGRAHNATNRGHDRQRDRRSSEEETNDEVQSTEADEGGADACGDVEKHAQDRKDNAGNEQQRAQNRTHEQGGTCSGLGGAHSFNGFNGTRTARRRPRRNNGDDRS